MSQKRLLVLGVGNPLAGDDGVGIEVVRRLKKEKLPGNVDIVEGYTLSFQLLNFFEKYDKVIIVDAVISDGKSGRVRKIDLKDTNKSDFSVLTSHEFDIFRVLKILSLFKKTPEVVVIGIEVEKLDGLGLSSPVENSVNEAVKKIMEEIRHSLKR